MEPEVGLEVELSPEEMKEAEREVIQWQIQSLSTTDNYYQVIQRQIETTEAQLEAMEKMEEEGGGGDMLDDATVQALKVNTCFVLLDATASLAPTPVRWLVVWSITSGGMV